MISDQIGQYWSSLLVILTVFTVGVASPGPATLMILDVAMSQGRRSAIALSLGVVTGSMFWATVAALGFVAAIKTSAVLFTMMKIAGGLYLLYLAVRSLRSAISPKTGDAATPRSATAYSFGRNFFKGLLLHLTNPKAPLVWLATLSAGLESIVQPSFFIIAIGSCALIATLVFVGYAVLFSTGAASRAYIALRRPFDFVIGALFGAAAIKLLTLRAV